MIAHLHIDHVYYRSQTIFREFGVFFATIERIYGIQIISNIDIKT